MSILRLDCSIGAHPHSYLLPLNEDFVASADFLLGWEGSFFPVHTQLLAHKSCVFAALFRVALGEQQLCKLPTPCTTRPVHQWGSAALPVLDLTTLEALPAASPQHFESFISHVYETSLAHALEIGEARVLLQLADFFQAQCVTDRVEAWICNHLRHVSTSPELADLAVSAFELSVQHRLAEATANLLPWAHQTLIRGSLQGVVWADVRRRRERLHAAMSLELKALTFDLVVWSTSIHLPPCKLCGCRPTDLMPAFDVNARKNWKGCVGEDPPPCCATTYLAVAAATAAAREPPRIRLEAGPSPYTRTVAHFLHLLREEVWPTAQARPS